MPFCFHGFWFPPTTYFRIFVAAVPWRWLFRNARTAWCSTGSFTVPSKVASGSANGALWRAPAADHGGIVARKGNKSRIVDIHCHRESKRADAMMNQPAFPVGSAITRRDGVMASVVVHAALFAALLFLPQVELFGPTPRA